MGRTFAITAMGRSGTKFLAQTLGQSPSWEVKHEPGGKQPLAAIARRFEFQSHYGESNSFLRWDFPRIPGVTVRAIVLRHPQQLVVSAFNRKGWNLDKKMRNNFRQSFGLLDQYIRSGVRTFRFERFTTDVQYLQELVEFVGIMDLKITPAMIAKPVNATPDHKRRAKVLADLPQETQDWYTEELGWYEREYYG